MLEQWSGLKCRGLEHSGEKEGREGKGIDGRERREASQMARKTSFFRFPNGHEHI